MLDNATILTSACLGTLWQGIVIEGNENQIQTNQHQGMLEIKNGAIIENAVRPVIVNSGGILKATNATFRNNLQSVYFYPYINNTPPYTDNISSFTQCTFYIDNNNFFTPNLRPDAFVRLNGVRGVTFKGTSFENKITVGKYGIWAIDAGFKVINECTYNFGPLTGLDCDCPENYTTPCVFKSLDYGIYATNSGLAPYSIFIDQCKFIDNNKSVEINSFDNFRLTRNSFSGIKEFGLKSNNSSGYRIEENGFSGFLEPTVGIIINNSGMAENQIYKNSFSKCGKGISAESINASSNYVTGLRFLCNYFVKGKIDISVESNATIRTIQGDFPRGADNGFNMTTLSSLVINNTHPIVYYHSPGASFTPKSPVHTGNLTINGTAIASQCNSTFCKLQPRDGDSGSYIKPPEQDDIDFYQNLHLPKPAAGI